MKFSWIVIMILFGVGLKLGWPELNSFLKRWRRRKRWVGALHLKPAAVKLYEDPHDLDRLRGHLPQHSSEVVKLIQKHHQDLTYKPDRADLEIDVRLCHVAEWIAEALGRGQQSPSSALIRSLCSHFGLAVPIPIIIHQRQSHFEGFSSFLLRYDEQLKRALEMNAPQLMVGVAAHPLGNELICVAVIQPRHLSINPFARQVVGDVGLIIHGESREMMPLEAWVTHADGKSSIVSLQRNGSYFSLQLKDRARGVYQVEIIGESPSGPVVCLNVSVYRSVAPPSELILTEDQSPSRWTSLNRRRLYALINESRLLINQPRLPQSRALQKIAQSYAQDMSTQSFVSHTSPQGQRLNHRTASLKDRAERILENLAAGSSIEEVHDQLMSSPIHRAAILDDEVTHVGVGVSVNQGIVYGVEVFSLMNRPLKLSEDRSELYRVVQRMRRDEGLGRLPHDIELEKVAQRVALALVNGECKPQEVNQHAQHLLDRKKQKSQSSARHNPRVYSGESGQSQGRQMSSERDFGSIEVHLCQISRVERLPPQEMWLQSQVKSFGVGLAQGVTHEPYWVVVVLRLQDSSPHLRRDQKDPKHLLNSFTESPLITREK
jgi:uncharacterized protein YkwD